MASSRMTLDEILTDLADENGSADIFVTTDSAPAPYHAGTGKAVLPPTTPGDNYLRNVNVHDMAPSAANRPSVVALTRNPGGAADGAGNVSFAAQKTGGQQRQARPVTMDPFAQLPHKSITGAELEREIAELNTLIESQRNSTASNSHRRYEETDAMKASYAGQQLNDIVASKLMISPQKNSGAAVAMPLVIEEVDVSATPVAPVAPPSWLAKLNDIIKDSSLGMGVFGESFKATWQPLFQRSARLVIAKKWKCQDLSKAFLSTFEMTLRAHIALEPHPNLVAVIAGCTHEELLSLYEYCPGRSLDVVLKNTPNILTSQTVVHIAAQIADAIGHLHDHNVAHQALRPTNVFVDEHMTVKVSDWGFEFIKERVRCAGIMMGLEYTSPEAIMQQQQQQVGAYPVTEKVDQYAYAILLNHLLSKQMPFQGMMPRMIAVGVSQDALRPPIAPHCSYPLKRLIEACWMQDPSKRPAFNVIQNLIHQPVQKLIG